MSTETHDSNVRTYTPGNLLPKLLFFATALFVFGIGAALLWEPLGRILNGEITEARVSEIRVVEPGQPVRVYNYRREYTPVSNLSITFQHYVSINIDGRPTLHRISVDSRKLPVPDLNVNDRVKVAYYPNDPDRLAYAHLQERTWGAGGLIAGIGLVMLVVAVPMLFAVGRPILIDPEAAPTN